MIITNSDLDEYKYHLEYVDYKLISDLSFKLLLGIDYYTDVAYIDTPSNLLEYQNLNFQIIPVRNNYILIGDA